MKRQKIGDLLRTSAQLPKTSSHSILTLSDWITIYSYIDSHPDSTQADIVQHFSTLPTGALVFNQSTLSRKLRDRPKMEARINDSPTALSSKKPCTVTRPDVERALYLWVQHMENKGEVITGPMLLEKCKRFEEEFGVPEKERLTGGWLHSFCKTYKIREHRRHGEAGSVDLVAVEAERERCQKILEQFAPRDRFNFDETAFFP
jgi:Tc5 transposase DNA-binding domain